MDGVRVGGVRDGQADVAGVVADADVLFGKDEAKVELAQEDPRGDLLRAALSGALPLRLESR